MPGDCETCEGANPSGDRCETGGPKRREETRKALDMRGPLRGCQRVTIATGSAVNDCPPPDVLGIDVRGCMPSPLLLRRDVLFSVFTRMCL